MKDKIKTKRRPKSLRAMTLRLAAGILAVWLVCMVCMTLVTAQTMFDLLVDTGETFMESAANWMYYRYDEDISERETQTPGYLENGMLTTLNNYDSFFWRGRTWLYEDGEGWGISLLRDEGIPIQTAIIFADGQGNIIQANRDFLSFYYFTEERWEQENGEPEGVDGYAWIDLSDAEDPRYRFFRGEYSSTGSFFSLIRNMRITGIMDGNRIEPLKMDFKGERMRLNANLYLKYDLTDTDDGWTNLFDDTDTSALQGELVTIYTGYPEMSVYDPGGPVGTWKNDEYWERYGENHAVILGQSEPEKMTYANLMELLDTMRRAAGEDGWGNVCYWQKRMDDLIILNDLAYRLDHSDPDWGEYDFTMYTAFRVSPLWSAVALLRNVYIGTFLLALVVFWRLRKSFRENLIQPVAVINEAMRENYQYPQYYLDFDPDWAGGYELVSNYKDMREQLRMRKNEVTRLNTALDYAKRAEAKRRQMTSNIAHELKTPLAVVHSYAEGLQEHIAEEKREKYLEVILSETERMDAMVLEMLDLSRLEAGKVKLARDEFDLAALAKSVFEALSIKAEEKSLEVTLELDEPVMVSADEGRIRQVIENYASNAVKYTPEGGKITAKILAERGKTVFVVENESPPLPPEALVRVWDSFYRVDDSRTGRAGTGLGLAIAKSIVELHGGRVDVRNTKTGVEFRFTI